VSEKLPWFLRAPGGVPARERVLTADEMGARRAKIDAELAALECKHKKARGAERDLLLVAALNLCGGLRYWVYIAVCEALLARQPPLPKDRRHHYIFRAYLDLRDDDGVPRFGWEEALHLAVEKLAELGEPASETTVRKHYARVERELPPAARRPRTHSRHRRPLGQK
jgi:hypothetical protein